MWDKFGEFDSAEEINRIALNLREEGDVEALKLLVLENGIDEEDGFDFADGLLDELVTNNLAAFGKLDIESKELKLDGILKDWVDELKALCAKDEALASAVRRKGKDLAGYIALIIEEGYKNRVVVDKRIVNRAGMVKNIIGTHEFSIGIQNMAERKRLARIYYMGEGDKK